MTEYSAFQAKQSLTFFASIRIPSQLDATEQVNLSPQIHQLGPKFTSLQLQKLEELTNRKPHKTKRPLLAHRSKMTMI